MPSGLTTKRHPLVPILVAVVLVVPAWPASASGKSSDPQAQRRELQAKRAKNAAQVNVLKASDAELGTALDQLNENVRAQESRAADARQAAAAAVEAVKTARQNEERTAARLAGLRRLMRRSAVEAYVRGPSQRAIVVLDAKSLSQQATRQYLLDVALGQGSEVADNLRAAGQDLTAERAATEEAQVVAAARQQEVDSQLGVVKQAQTLKQQVADSVEQRLEAALAESDSLAALDKQLAAEIARRQAALAARIGSSARGGVRGVVHIGAVAVTSVRGIVVATAIAQQVENLLAAAAADGFVLGGAGYRSSDDQVAVRRAHCGSSDYAIYQEPASSCRPPTARPGQSMHEQGLAIDFTWNGSIVSGRNAAFQWLRANASRFGLYNLPAEPWHWSVNGN